MTQSRFIPMLVVVAVALLVLWQSIFIVDPRQQKAVKRLGEILHTQSEPGLYFKVPFLDQITVVDNRLRHHALPTATVQTQNGAFYEVDAFFTYRITNPRLFLQQIPSGNPAVAEQNNLAPRFALALRTVFGSRDLRAALSAERVEMMAEVQEEFAKDAELLGMTVVDVRIRKTDLSREVSQQTFERMRSERIAAAEAERARGNEERERIRAEANREHDEIVASARRDAEILRGEAESEKVKILNEARRTDAEFYDYLRTLDAYQTSRDVPMVLSPRMDFFRYLRSITPE